MSRGFSMHAQRGVVLFIVRPQIATLWIDRKAGTVNGRLEGSGYPQPSET